MEEKSRNFECKDLIVNTEVEDVTIYTHSRSQQFYKCVSKKRLKFESVVFISMTKFVYFKAKISQYQTSPAFRWQQFETTKDICKFCDWELNF